MNKPIIINAKDVKVPEYVSSSDWYLGIKGIDGGIEEFSHKKTYIVFGTYGEFDDIGYTLCDDMNELTEENAPTSKYIWSERGSKEDLFPFLEKYVTKEELNKIFKDWI